MEFTREIYWNVGHGIDTLLPMYLLTLAALTVLAIGFWRRVKVYRQGQTVDRLDQLPTRIATMLKGVLLQKKVVRVKGPGVAHGLFFLGFFLLFLGTCLIVVQADFTDLLFGIKFLKGNFYLLFSVVLDLAGLLAIIMLGWLFVRRYLKRPEGLESKADDAIMHGLLFAILISGFVVEGARMAVTELGTTLAFWSPVGLLFAKAFSGLGEEGLRSLHIVSWWSHFALVIAFIALIPFTKFRHIFTTSLNYLFADQGPKGTLVAIDMDDETVENFGASTVAELSWKDIFDTDACTQCMRCQDRCPAHNTEKPLSPMKLVNRIGESAFKAPQENLIEACGEDAIWSCTTCRACQETCPASIEHVNKIVALRRNQVMMESDFPAELLQMFRNVETYGDPWAVGTARRKEWEGNVKVKDLSAGESAEVLYWVGCSAVFDNRYATVAQSLARLMDKAGVDFGTLGTKERCCGDFVRGLGNEYLYQSLAKQNIAQLNECGVKKIVVSCPHCYNTLKNEYPRLGGNFEVVHHTQMLAELLADGQLQPTKSLNKKITYHDSCYLGRFNDEYAAPREILAAIPGVEIVEAERNCEEGFCCGAGGGYMWLVESGQRINETRAKELISTGSDQVATACPHCLNMLDDGVTADEESEQKPEVLDLTEILEKVL